MYYSYIPLLESILYDFVSGSIIPDFVSENLTPDIGKVFPVFYVAIRSYCEKQFGIVVGFRYIKNQFIRLMIQ